MRVILIIGSVLTCLTLAGCGGSTRDGGGGRAVVAAFYPLAFAAEQVGAADVRNLTPAGTEPHDLELSAGDVAAVDDAELVLYLGDGFMPALERAVDARSGPSLDLLAPADVRATRDGTRDPHVWLDPLRYAAQARAIATALGNPDAAEPFVRRLEALDREFVAGLGRCTRREIVTSHAAFGYLADRYGLEQIALSGVEPESEPHPRELAELARAVEASGATTVFVESLASPKVAETVAREAGVATAVLNPLEGLTEQQLDDGADYFTVMRQNLAALRTALDCG